MVQPDLSTILFEHWQEARIKFESFMDSDAGLEAKIGVVLDMIVREASPFGHLPYSTQFLDRFRPRQIKAIFGHNAEEMLVLIWQVIEDRRFANLSYAPYFLFLLPEILKKAKTQEEILKWDSLAKDCIAYTNEVINYESYARRPLRNLIIKSPSLKIFETAVALVTRAKLQKANVYVFTDALSLLAPKAKANPKKLEEWYYPLLDATRRCYGDIVPRYHLVSLRDFLRRNSPSDLVKFSAY